MKTFVVYLRATSIHFMLYRLHESLSLTSFNNNSLILSNDLTVLLSANTALNTIWIRNEKWACNGDVYMWMENIGISNVFVWMLIQIDDDSTIDGAFYSLWNTLKKSHVYKHNDTEFSRKLPAETFISSWIFNIFFTT